MFHIMESRVEQNILAHVFKPQTKGRNKCSLYLNAASVGVSCIYQLVNKVEQNIKENVSHNGITCRTKY